MARLGHVLRCQRIDATLALDQLHHHAGGLFVDRRLQGRDVIGGNEAHARNQWFEILPVLWLTSDRERAQRAAVEGVLKRNDLVLLRVDGAAVRVNHFERALDGLGPGIREEGARQAAHFHQALGERTLILVVIQVRAMDQQPGLFAEDLQNARMGVAQGVDPDPRQEIEVAAALQIVQIAAFPARKDERIPGVSLQQKIPLQVNHRLGGGLH